jgi:hypothetical protein
MRKCEKRKEIGKSPEEEGVQRKVKRCRKKMDPTNNYTRSGIVCWNPNRGTLTQMELGKQT